MSLTLNTASGGSAAAATSFTFNITGVNVGDLILVWPVINSSSAPTVADGQGSYTAQGSYVVDTNSGWGSQIFTLVATVSGTHAVVVTNPASVAARYLYQVFTPSGGAVGFDGVAQVANSTATNPRTVTVTNTQSGDTVCSFGVNWSGSTTSSQSGTNTSSGGAGTGFVGQYQLQPGSGAVSPSITYTTSASGTMNAIGLYISSASSAGLLPLLICRR